jgi:hypothetical protein
VDAAVAVVAGADPRPEVVGGAAPAEGDPADLEHDNTLTTVTAPGRAPLPVRSVAHPSGLAPRPRLLRAGPRELRCALLLPDRPTGGGAGRLYDTHYSERYLGHPAAVDFPPGGGHRGYAAWVDGSG